jgi:hypothetical protein
MELFHYGLNPELHEHLMLFHGCTLNELVSASIVQEDACCAHMEEERKMRPLPRPTRTLHPSTILSTPLRYGSRAIPLYHSNGAIVHLSRWHHALQSSHSINSTSSSATCSGRLPMLQLQADWALPSRVHPSLTGLLCSDPVTTG